MSSYLVQTVLYGLWTFFLPPFLCVLMVTLVCASFGRSLGIRRLYVKVLLQIFEVTRKITVEHHRQKHLEHEAQFKVGASDSEDEDDPALSSAPQATSAANGSVKGIKEEAAGDEDSEESKEQLAEMEDLTHRKKFMKNFGKESRHNVISRKDNLMLSPDKPVLPEEHKSPTKDWSAQIMAGKKVSAATLQREFELDDILDYIKTGIASVIEDEVTQRFVAEELKSWNLLTRTSQSFEFINIRLTIIWIIGFFVRYFILLPGRTCILVVGLLYMLVGTFIVSLLPFEFLRRGVYNFVALTSFRILSRSFSAAVSFHNVQHRPKSDGICVANHTTPIDVVILQYDQSYALMFWFALCMAFVGQLPDNAAKKYLHHLVFTSCFQILGGALSAVITYHNPENRPKQGICVANHTSPIDVLILACDNSYALIGQRHGGALGKFQNLLSHCAGHIWFERSDTKDRAYITHRLKDHVEDPNKLPILIFPEGTCINNTSVMQFKKGSFEVGGTIYPVAIKYDPKFGDAFWNSSNNGMISYLYMMMTSWAIVCDVWYLPPMVREEGEDAVHFANRVKAEIARQGGLVDLMWDGNLKRMNVKSEWKAKQQEEFSKRIKVE